MALEAIVVREVRWAGDDENNEDDEPPVFSKIISTDEPSDVTLWPEPITTIDDGDESEPPRFSKIQSTTDDVAEDTERWPFPTETLPIVSSDPSTMVTQTIITEESTITGGLITKTDSGRTVTVPNNEVVTVTRHTVIITDKPPPLPTETTFQTSGVLTSSLPGGETTQVPEQEGREDVDGESHGPSLTTGALVGVSVGGAIVIALFILVVFGLRKRRQKSRDDGDAARPIEYGRDQDLEEKHFPEQMTPHTTGTQPDDPFAPFGGRVDRSGEAASVLQSPSNVFEMDATATAPVELPTISPGANPRPRSASTEDHRRDPIGELAHRDPRANLNSLGIEGGEPRYVNHWNEYRAMGCS